MLTTDTRDRASESFAGLDALEAPRGRRRPACATSGA